LGFFLPLCFGATLNGGGGMIKDITIESGEKGKSIEAFSGFFELWVFDLMLIF